MVGIKAYGAYVPRLRLDRMSVFQNVMWIAPGLMMFAQGERSICNWDEDTMTMAVSASQDCLTGMDKSKVDAAYLASTSLPFNDRQNAGIMAAALNLKEEGLMSADVSGSLKAGTSAVLTALEGLQGGERENVLVTASEARQSKAGWMQELWYGDAAASLLLGKDDVIAEYKGSYSVSADFMPHYRGHNKKYDYMWEERWIRDEGYSKLIPAAIKGLLDKTGVAMDDIAKVCYPCVFKRHHTGMAKKMGLGPEKLQDNLYEVVGEAGAAHPVLMMTAILQEANPGDKIIMCSFGQGCDALLFEVTDKIKSLGPRKGVKGSLANKKTETNYMKYLKFNDLVNMETGIRSEVKMQTALSALWRNRKMILGFTGGKCTKCNTPQFPKMHYCVNPDCDAHDTQEDHEFSGKPGVIKSFTADMLAVSLAPPALYGLIHFEGGGGMMAEFTDCVMDEVKVGQKVNMAFRIKYYDKDRDFHGYFWKAVPEIG